MPDRMLKLVEDSRDEAKLLLYLSDMDVPPSSPCTPKLLSDRDLFLNEFDDRLDSWRFNLAAGSWHIWRWFLCFDEF